jgi:hypothetical protein
MSNFPPGISFKNGTWAKLRQEFLVREGKGSISTMENSILEDE